MPIINIGHPEPFMMVMGTMLYPGFDDEDRRKAKAYTSQILAKEVIPRAQRAGYAVPLELQASFYADSGEILDDLERRRRDGHWTGFLLMAHHCLAQDYPKFATLENAIRIAEIQTTRAGKSGARSSFLAAKKQFITVAHFWAALLYRDGIFVTDPTVGYDGFADFESFFAEAEKLRGWGTALRSPLDNGKSPWRCDAWRMPDDWSATARQHYQSKACQEILRIENFLTELVPIPGL